MRTSVADLLATLDDRQRSAATLGRGPAQIIAPAGSGKTATLVARIIDTLGLTPGTDGPEVRTLHALARQVVDEGQQPPRLVADRLPLLRRARRQVPGHASGLRGTRAGGRGAGCSGVSGDP